jgi:zinc transport system ATP-binding protein
MQIDINKQQAVDASVEPPLLEVKDLSVSLGGDQILDDIDLEVRPGSIHALIGPNGAGKTTLIRSVMGGMPHQGTIRFRFRKSGRIGYVPQLLEFDHSVPITVGDFITIMLQDSPVLISGVKKMRPQVEQILKATGCDHLIDRLIGGLSGGEIRRVLLAQALAPLPELLLLDEPASSVDEHGAMLFEQILLRLKSEHGIAILMVGHDIPMILRIADLVTSVNRTVTFKGHPKELSDTEKVAGLFRASSLPIDKGSGGPY